MRKLRLFLTGALFFCLFAGLYLLLWNLLKQDMKNYLGFIFWSWSPAQDIMNYGRVFMIGLIFDNLFPILVGVTGARWGIYWHAKWRFFKVREQPAR